MRSALPLTRRDYLRRGIQASCVGVGLLLAYGFLNLESVGGTADARAWCLGLGPILLLFGIGNLVFHNFFAAGIWIAVMIIPAAWISRSLSRAE